MLIWSAAYIGVEGNHFSQGKTEFINCHGLSVLAIQKFFGSSWKVIDNPERFHIIACRRNRKNHARESEREALPVDAVFLFDFFRKVIELLLVVGFRVTHSATLPSNFGFQLQKAGFNMGKGWKNQKKRLENKNKIK